MEYEKEKRTDSQNNSLHKWLTMIAQICNEEGVTLRAIAEQLPQAECPATKENLKQIVWKPIQLALFSKESTTELNKNSEIDKVVDVITKHFAEHHHLSLPPFPHEDNQ